MFINVEEDYGLGQHERPNWINFVRPPIDRLVSFFYYFKFRPATRVIQHKKSNQPIIDPIFSFSKHYQITLI